jgi:hypothetical protein
MGNLIILPLMFYYLKEHSWKHKWQDALGFLSPYVVIGVLLMVYNYARFGSILEFGQSYQLTNVDVGNVATILDAPTIGDKLKMLLGYGVNVIRYLFRFSTEVTLPQLGTVVTFPILVYIAVGIISKKQRTLIKTEKCWLFAAAMLLTPVVILVLDVLGSPDIFPRYRMDTYWIFGILAYFFLGTRYQVKKNKAAFSSLVCYFAIVTAVAGVVLMVCPNDFNFTVHYREQIEPVLPWLY